MRTRCCSLLIVALVLVACGSDSADPDAGSTSTTAPTTTEPTTTESPTTAAANDPDPGSDGGLGESVGVTDDVTITVLDDEG